MHNTLILPYSEADTDIIAFINTLRSRKKPFKIQPSDASASDDENIVWDWEGCENAEYKLSMIAWGKDWDSEADKVWDNL